MLEEEEEEEEEVEEGDINPEIMKWINDSNARSEY